MQSPVMLGLFRGSWRALSAASATEAVKPGLMRLSCGCARAGAGHPDRFGAHRRLNHVRPPRAFSGKHGVSDPGDHCCALDCRAGILVGILAGLFGIGGGAIIVPVLYSISRARRPKTFAYRYVSVPRLIIVPTTVRSYLGHKKKGAVLPNVVRIWALPAIIGVAIGSVTASFAPAPVFKIAFLVFATFIAIRMLFGGDRWKLGNEMPGRGVLAIYGFITGLFSSLVGVSGGAISNAVLTLYGRPMQQAVGTSAGVGVPITIAGTIGYVLAGWSHMAQCRRCRSASCRSLVLR